MEIILFIQSYKTPFLDYLFQFITMTGEQPFFVLLACWFVWCYDKETGWKIGFIFLTGTVLNGIIKNVFRIPRPIGHGDIVSLRTQTAKGYSFPSGHTQAASLFWFSVMKIYRKQYLYIAGTAAVILAGVSRLYLGVHWPSDVIGGVLIGAAWVYAAGFIWERFRITESIKAAAVIIAVLFIFCIIFPEQYIARTAGAAAGFIAGIHFEKRYIGFIVSHNRYYTLLKMIPGLAVIVLIMTGRKILLPAGIIPECVSFVLIGLWITFGAPFIFSRLNITGHNSSK